MRDRFLPADDDTQEEPFAPRRTALDSLHSGSPLAGTGILAIPLCPACVAACGNGYAGPESPWRPAGPGEACEAADCRTCDSCGAVDSARYLGCDDCQRDGHVCITICTECGDTLYDPNATK